MVDSWPWKRSRCVMITQLKQDQIHFARFWGPLSTVSYPLVTRLTAYVALTKIALASEDNMSQFADPTTKFVGIEVSVTLLRAVLLGDSGKVADRANAAFSPEESTLPQVTA